MEKVLQHLHSSLVGIHSGGVTPAYLDTVKVAYYGQQTPISRLATTSINKNQILVTPFDPETFGMILKSLKESGFNAFQFSKTAIAVSVPPLSGEELDRTAAHIRKLGEDAKVSIRNLRRILRDELAPGLPKDARKRQENDLQKLTDEAIRKVDEIVNSKIDRLRPAAGFSGLRRKKVNDGRGQGTSAFLLGGQHA